MRRVRFAAVAPLVGLAPLAAVAGCDDPLGPSGQVEVASERWERHGAPDYSFVLDRYCECLVTGPVRLTVTADDVVAAEALAGSSAPPGSHPDPAQFPTIDELFEQLRAAAEAGPVRFEVEFERELGYPRSADVDVSAQIADEELAYEVRDVMLFEPLTDQRGGDPASRAALPPPPVIS